MKLIMHCSNKTVINIMFWLFMAISHTAIAITSSGVDYRKITTADKQVIHILEVDPTVIDIKLVRAKDVGHSRETVITIAQHYNAIAAVNGGFFRVNNYGEGLAAGLLKINKKLYGIAYKPRAAIGWNNNTNVTLFDRIQTKTTVTINGHALHINAMNAPLTANSAVLYSNSYDRKSLRFGENAMHFTITNNKITKIQSQPTIHIPKNGYIYSVGSNLTKDLPALNIGDPVTITAKLQPLLTPETTATWEQMPYVLGGAVLLLKDGNKIVDHSTEGLPINFLNTLYARTAIGTLSNGNWLLAIVEKHFNDETSGLTIPKLATVMQELGCNNAINLDGGGSSTMYYNDTLINHPEGDKDEALGFTVTRKVTDAIVLLPKS